MMILIQNVKLSYKILAFTLNMLYSNSKVVLYMNRKDKIIGCLMGGAIGDALGYQIEFKRGI